MAHIFLDLFINNLYINSNSIAVKIILFTVDIYKYLKMISVKKIPKNKKQKRNA